MLHILSIIGATIFMIFFFGLCIFVHELGHFLAARWRGMYVSAFSIGFKKVWSKKYKGVEYRIGCIPVGGYVEIPEIDSADKEIRDADGNLLKHAKPLDRMIAVVAGPLFNFIFGFLIAGIIWIAGIPQDTPNMKEIEVASISVSSPEYKAGLRKGDRIIRFNGRKIDTSWNGFVREIVTAIGKVTLTVERNGRELEVTYRPAPNKAVMPDEEIAYPFFMPKCAITIYPEPGKPADRAGLQWGDKVLSVNGEPVLSLSTFESLLDVSDGEAVSLTIERKGQEMTVSNVLPEPIEVDGRKGEWLVGVIYSVKDNSVVVDRTVPGKPAALAGLQKGDVLLKADGQKIDFQTFGKEIRSGEGKAISLELLRNGKTMTVSLTPAFKRYRSIGVRYAYIAHPTPWKQFTDVMDITWKSLRGLFVGIGHNLGLTEQTTTIKPRHMSGPIGIGRILYLSVYRGSLIEGLSLVVLLSFNLGLLNLLPIPVLDGGHVLLALLELIFRRRVPESLVKPISIAFVAILIGFMIFVTYYDTKRLVRGFRTPPSQEMIREMHHAEEKASAKAVPEVKNVPAK